MHDVARARCVDAIARSSQEGIDGVKVMPIDYADFVRNVRPPAEACPDQVLESTGRLRAGSENAPPDNAAMIDATPAVASDA